MSYKWAKMRESLLFQVNFTPVHGNHSLNKVALRKAGNAELC